MASGGPPIGRRLAALSWAERLLLIEAAGWLALARLAVVLLPFRVTSRRLGTHMAETSAADVPGAETSLRRVAWAIGAVARRTPWRSKCLEQAIAAKAMLRARGLPSTMYVGLARSPAAEWPSIDAHAWVRCGSVNVTGGSRVDRYAVVSTFADLAR